MKPYWSDGRIELYHGDVRQVLPALTRSGGHGDLDPLDWPLACVTDPPYAQTSASWDTWPVGWINAVKDVLPADATLWCFLPTLVLLKRYLDFRSAGFRFTGQEQLWVKPNGTGGVADRFLRVHESARHFVRGRWSEIYHAPPRLPAVTAGDKSTRRAASATPHRRPDAANAYQDDGLRLMRSVVITETDDLPVVLASSVRRVGRNIAEKPIATAAPLIVECAPPGAVVLDPFAGSGAILAACALLGRRAIGVELREEACEQAALRLSQAIIPMPQGSEQMEITNG